MGYRQSASNGSSLSQTTIPQALGSAVLQGSRLVAYIVWGQGTTGSGVNSVSDTINGTSGWVRVTGSNAKETSGPTQGEVWTNPNSAAGPAPTITATFDNGSGTITAQPFRAIDVHEITGTDPTEGAAALASVAVKSTAATSFTTPNITPAVNGSYIFGACSNDLNSVAPTAAGAFNLREVTTSQVTGSEDQVQAVAAPIGANFSFASAVTGIVNVVAFKPASGASAYQVGTRQVLNAKGPYDALGFLKARVWDYTLPAPAGVSLAITSSTEDSTDAALTERISAAVGSSTEDASAATVVERVSAAIGSSTEDSSNATVVERVGTSIGSSTEDASGATLAERIGTTVGSSTEDFSGATVAERVGATIGSSTEDFSGATVTQRVGTTVASSTEDYSDATLALPSGNVSLSVSSSTEDASDASLTERIAAAVASSTEDSSAAAVAERLAASIASATEDGSAATLVERFPANIASVSEDASAAALTERIAAAVDSISETSSDATLSVPIPNVSLSIASTSETTSDIVGAPAVDPRDPRYDTHDGILVHAHDDDEVQYRRGTAEIDVARMGAFLVRPLTATGASVAAMPWRRLVAAMGLDDAVFADIVPIAAHGRARVVLYDAHLDALAIAPLVAHGAMNPTDEELATMALAYLEQHAREADDVFDTDELTAQELERAAQELRRNARARRRAVNPWHDGEA